MSNTLQLNVVSHVLALYHHTNQTITMSSTALSATGTASSAMPSSTCSVNLNAVEFPTKDAGCAVPNSSDHKSILDKCCKDAPVKTWADDCGLYCLAADQSVDELSKCWQGEKGNAALLFCNNVGNATATGDVKGDDKDGDKASKTGENGAKETGKGEPGAATRGLSKSGLGLLGMLLGSVMLASVL